LNAEAYFWRERYREQIGWSRDTRRAILDELHIQSDTHLLDVGSGFGALLNALQADGYANLIGLDIDFLSLTQSEGAFPLACGNGLHLPFSPQMFDACLCHYFLLWAADPLTALREMVRVTTPGGWVIALAEPDYGGRVDYPSDLAPLGQLQNKALIAQGADIYIGRRLGELFTNAGLRDITCGILPARWPALTDQINGGREWRVLEKDLAGRVPADELAALHESDTFARQSGARVLYVPTFYAFGRVI